MPVEPLLPFDRYTDVDVLCRSCSLGESEFERDAAFQVVAVEDTFAHGSFKYAAKRQERYPATKTLLRQALLFGDSGQCLFEAFNWSRLHTPSPGFRSLMVKVQKSGKWISEGCLPQHC